MAWPDGRYIQATVFFSRWLLSPFLIGLLVCMALLIYRFFADLFLLIPQVPGTDWHNLITEVLNLVDLALTANLILIVIFSSYENFIRRMDPSDYPDWPEGLTQVDFGELKQKLLGSIVGLCRDLGIEIIAEGIETPAERDALVRVGGDLCQGYLFARPEKPWASINFDR